MICVKKPSGWRLFEVAYMYRSAIRNFRISAVALAALWLSFSPSPLPDPHIQKILHPFDHVLLHAGLAVICLMEWPAYPYRVLAGLIVTALCLELFQLAIPARAFELRDIIANVAGVGSGSAIYGILRRLNSTIQRRRLE